MRKNPKDKNILFWLIGFTKPFKLWIVLAFFAMLIVASFESVSYTHLRAHET